MFVLFGDIVGGYYMKLIVFGIYFSFVLFLLKVWIGIVCLFVCLDYIFREVL